MKKISLPARMIVGAGKEGPVKWGLVEYLLHAVFVRDDLYANKEFCEMVANLHPQLMALVGEAQDAEGLSLTVTDDDHSILVKLGTPKTGDSLAPEIQFAVAQCRISILSAEKVKESSSS